MRLILSPTPPVECLSARPCSASKVGARGGHVFGQKRRFVRRESLQLARHQPSANLLRSHVAAEQSLDESLNHRFIERVSVAFSTR
jgi:hypothetical protein